MERHNALTVGEVEILPIHDVAGEFVPTEFLPAMPTELWGDYVEGDPTRPVESRVLCYLVRSVSATALVDCGVGEWGSWRLGDGALIAELERLGVDRDGVDFVILTHLHFDHIGGAMRPGRDAPSANFPNARHLVSRADWEHFTSPAYLSGPADVSQSMVNNVLLPLAELDLVDVVDPGHAVTASISLIDTPGHTPGSTTIGVVSDGAAALLIGDVAHHQVQLEHPEWSSGADNDPAAATASRRRIVAEAVRLGAYVGAAHFDRRSPALAPMVQRAGGYRWDGRRDGSTAPG